METTNTGIFDSKTLKIIDAIDVYQCEINEFCGDYNDDMWKHNKQFNKQIKPYFNKRAEILDKIPNFWYKAINNHPDLGTLFVATEVDCLIHLNKVEVEEVGPHEAIQSDYTISFHFEKNPYFKNSVLVKQFRLLCSGKRAVQITNIEWEEGKRLPKTSGRYNGPLGKASFFGWFHALIDPASDQIAHIFKDDLWRNPIMYFKFPEVKENESTDE